MTLNSISAKSIPNDTKFVAIYADGSGARLFMIDEANGLYCAENGYLGIMAPDRYLLDGGFSYWMQLPDSFELWFEGREEKRP